MFICSLLIAMSVALLRQIHPLEWDATRNEPFLRLPAPLSHIIITPPRESDAAEKVPHLNDPKVYNGLSNPPWPHIPAPVGKSSKQSRDLLSFKDIRTMVPEALLTAIDRPPGTSEDTRSH